MNWNMYTTAILCAIILCMEEKFIKWFIKEIPILTEKGIISAQVAHSLNEYYINKLAELEKPSAPKTEAAPPQNLDPAFSELTTIQKPSKKSEQVTAPVHSPAPARAKKTSKLSVSVILTIIASVLISFGIISLIAYNWAAIPRMAKAVTAILLLVGAQIAGIILLRTGKASVLKVRESYSLFWALLFGSMVAFVSQIFKFPGDSSSFMFVWTLSTIIITLLFSAYTTFYLSMLFILIFGFISMDSTSAILLYPLLVTLYFAARKSKKKVIPLLILGFVFYVIRVNHMFINGNIRNMILVFSYASIGYILLQKKDSEVPYSYMGIIIIALASIISIYVSTFHITGYRLTDKKYVIAIKSIELGIIGLISTGFYVQGVVIPFIKKIRNNEKLNFENLVYLIPFILGLNALFPKQTEILLTAPLSEWYRILISPFTLMVLYTMTMFVLYSKKKHKLSCFFLAFLILQLLKINELSVSLYYSFTIITIFTIAVILWKNDFSDTDESSVTLITTRVLSAILFFIPAFMSLVPDSNFYKLSKAPLIGFFAYTPAAIAGTTLFVLYAKKNLKSFLKNLDIIINLIFGVVSIAAANEADKTAIDLIIRIFAVLNFMYYSTIAIKKQDYKLLLNTGLSIAFFVLSLMNPEHGTSILYLLCLILIFATGSFLWKNNFNTTAETKNCLILVRVAAVIILFSTILLARNTGSILYKNEGLDHFILFGFAPVAVFGLLMCGLFAKKNFKEFLLNIDIIVNTLVSAVILSVAYLCDEKIILLILEFMIAINLITSCVYIIRSGRYEYAFYALSAVLYFVISFISHEFSTTILYLISSIILFTSGVFLWREDFKLNDTSKQILSITRIVSAVFLLGTTILAKYPESILFDNTGIETYILICFTPAAIFGLTLYIILAKKNLKLFLQNLDIIINLIFATVIFAIAFMCKAEPIQLISEILIILNLIAACIFILLFRKNEYLYYPAISLIYFFVSYLNTDGTNIAAGVFFLISITAAVIHYFAQTKNSSPAKVIYTITTGIVLFYETSLRNACEGNHNHIAKNFFIISCMIIMGATAIYYLIQLIRNRHLFNPAVFLTPALVISLTFMDDKFSVLLSFPLVLLFCVYYFYLAYKNNSLKTANLSTVYFGLMLMIRFFSSGYGLSVQGITLISMGAILLIMNILMTKRREKNE